MKAVAYMKPGVELVDIPEPVQPDKKDWVKIKTAYVGICGTDAHIAAGHFDPLIPVTPFPMGHEVSGIVEELGPEATAKGLVVGDRIAFYFNEHCGKCHFCRNGQENMCVNIQANLNAMTEYVYASEQQVFRLPDNVSLLEGALAEPVSFCMHVMEVGRVKPGSTVVISGGGAIGLVTLEMAKLAGASKITVIEPVAEKRKIAKDLGAHYTIDPLNEDVESRIDTITGGLGFDTVFECSGAPVTIQAALDYVGRGGTVVYVAFYGPEGIAKVDLWNLFEKEVVITAPHQSPYTWERTMNVLQDLDLEVFTQCVYQKEQCSDAFAMQATSTQTKVIIQMCEELEIN